MSQKTEWEELNRKERLVREAAAILSVGDKDLSKVVDRFLKEIEEMKKSS
jgi:hypothetical protein